MSLFLFIILFNNIIYFTILLTYILPRLGQFKFTFPSYHHNYFLSNSTQKSLCTNCYPPEFLQCFPYISLQFPNNTSISQHYFTTISCYKQIIVNAKKADFVIFSQKSTFLNQIIFIYHLIELQHFFHQT